MTCCFHYVSPRLQLVRMWSFVGLRVDTTLELTDGHVECLRVTGNTKRRSFAPSAAGSKGSTISTGWHLSSVSRRTGGGRARGRWSKILGEWCNFYLAARAVRCAWVARSAGGPGDWMDPTARGRRCAKLAMCRCLDAVSILARVPLLCFATAVVQNQRSRSGVYCRGTRSCGTRCGRGAHIRA